MANINDNMSTKLNTPVTAATATATATASPTALRSMESSSLSTSTSSPPHYSENILRPLHNVELLQRKGSGASIKTCEVDLGDEERDTFSPVASADTSPAGNPNLVENCNGVAACSTASLITASNNNDIEPAMPMMKVKSMKANGSLANSVSLHATPSKEEKQRQNEEIVILETSSISSETGSWESVFPHTSALTVDINTIPLLDNHHNDLSNLCVDFMQNDPNISSSNFIKPNNHNTHTTNDNVAEAAIVNHDHTYLPIAQPNIEGDAMHQQQNPEFLLINQRDDPLSTSQTSNCFIDASSLCDEDETLSFPTNANSILQHPSDTNGKSQVEGNLNNINENYFELQGDDDDDDDDDGGDDDDSPTKQLETFHKSFARCKIKAKDNAHEELRPQSSSSVSSNEAEPNRHTSGVESASNLSDEEKLWKRDQDLSSQELKTAAIKKKSKVNSRETHNNHNNNNNNGSDDVTEASASLLHDADSSDSSDLFKLRREQERKYSLSNYNNTIHLGHPIMPSLTQTKLINNSAPLPSLVHPQNNIPNDLSYTTDYSSSSPAPSLVWSEHEHRSGNHQRFNLGEDYENRVKKFNYMLPDTPHNSIIHIESTSSNNSSMHREFMLPSTFSQHRDSGAYCSDATDSPVPLPRTPKKTKFDESNPIVSGGICLRDFPLKQCESPPIQRRTDSCPIVSGGFTSLDFEPTQPTADENEQKHFEIPIKPISRKPISGIASWVVDMRNSQNTDRRKSTTSSSTSSLENGHTKFRERSNSNSSNKSGCGFYISLDNTEGNSEKSRTEQMSKSYNSQANPTKFFVNLSNGERNETKNPEISEAVQKPPHKDSRTSNDSHKNLFSMFIDIGNGEKKTRLNSRLKEPFSLAQKMSSSLPANQRNAEDAMKSSISSTETLMSKSINYKNSTGTESNTSAESKSLDYKVNVESNTATAQSCLRRPTAHHKVPSDINKRHSWSNHTSNGNQNSDCKRSTSFTNNVEQSLNKNGGNNDKGLMNIIDKLPIISKASSLSIDSSISPYDECIISKSELSISSGCENGEDMGSSGGAGAGAAVEATSQNRVKKRRRDVQINETFDKSSLASIADSILSKDISPMSATDTDDLTFQQDEEKAIKETEALQQQLQQHQQQQPTLPSAQLTLSTSSNRMPNTIMETIMEAKETSSPKKSSSGITMESLHATIEKQKMLLETLNEHCETEKGSFVKLSDMDKPPKTEFKSPDRMSTSVGNHRQITRLYRDENRNRPHSWTMSRSIGNSFLNITSSVENMRSLSRLFPHISKEISNSLPNDMILDNYDYIQTDLSADSSLASSISRSGMDESSISCRQPRRLGEDLLKMFLQEIATDMIVEVHGRRLKAHKCILRSRCQYFAAVLAGNQTTSVVSLQGYSYSAVHFALCHIYSGASHPPDGISLMELAALADLLGLEGLKEVTSHALKTNYCHNFHKPCSGCIDGILQVLPVALNHALDDLYRKCLKWTCRHYVKVWPTRQFTQLPSDILARCRQQIVAYLTSESVLDTILDCDSLLSQLAAYRWGGVCESLVRDILEAAYNYMADHFASLIASDSFLSLGHDRSCHIPRLEGILLRTASSLTPDQVCRCYQRITRLNTVLQAKLMQIPNDITELSKELQGLQEEDLEWDPEYIRLVSALLHAIEQSLIRQCSRAMRVAAWQRMDLELRKKIQTLAHLTEPLDLKRNKSIAKALSFGGSSRSQDLHQVKLAIQAHTKRAMAQETHLYKATQTQEFIQTADRGVQANHDLRECSGRVLKSNSRVHVPQSQRPISQSTLTSERSSSKLTTNTSTHRRTKSEAPPVITNNAQKSIDNNSMMAKVKPQAIRFSEIRPRYLEPKKSFRTTQGPIRSSTSSSIPAATVRKQGYQQSSSESSRRSSPATRTHIIHKASGTKSATNISLDSMTSVAISHTKTNKSSDNDHGSDVYADSLTESLKSSAITNKTASRESLTAARLTKHIKPLKDETNKTAANGLTKLQLRKQNIPNDSNVKSLRPTTLTAKTSKYLQQKITSNGSSPSSITTNKSNTSRLSSISSTQSSQSVYKRSISVPNQNEPTTHKYTFLSAKSREILAKRAEKNKQLQLQQQNTATEKSVEKPNEKLLTKPNNDHLLRSVVSNNSSLVVNGGGRNTLASNIPTRRPNSLNLRKSFVSTAAAAAATNTTTNPNKTKKSLTGQNSQQVYQTAQAVKQKIELLLKTSTMAINETPAADENDNQPSSKMLESKLERSSTFCKESADIVDINELQIIE